MINLRRVSRWITIRVFPVTARHRLYAYAEPSDMGRPDGEQLVSAFRFRGRWYAVNQFLSRYRIMGFDQNCAEYPEYISGYDAENYFSPLYCELSDNGEKIRLYARG